MKTTNFSISLLFALASSACALGSEGIDSTSLAVEGTDTAPLLCGQDGRTVYALTCDELQASCDGDFLCYDEEPSRDGSCATWGECLPAPAPGVEPEEIDAPATAPEPGVEPEEIDVQ